jgi:HSP20 family protein
MSRFLERFAGREPFGDLLEESLREGWLPPVDIVERTEAIEIRADLPGVEPKAVDVCFEDGKITIRGERRLAEAREGESYHRVERSYGVFERSFAVPSSVDADGIEASFSDGQLVLHLPKREEARPQKIAIKG